MTSHFGDTIPGIEKHKKEERQTLSAREGDRVCFEPGADRLEVEEKGQEKEWDVWSIGLALFLSAAFGANVVAIKISVSGIGPFTAAGIRFLIASLVIFAWARMTGRSVYVHRKQVIPLLVIFLFFFFQISTFYVGIGRTNASRAVLISNLQPFFVLFMAHFFIRDDRITLRKIVGLALGFAGVCLVFLEREGVTEGFQTGDLLMVLSTSLWAASAVYTKTVLHRLSPHLIAFCQISMSVPLLFLCGILWDRPMIGALTAEVVLAVLYQALVAAAFGFVAWNTLLQHHGAVILNSFNFILPIAGVLLAWGLLNEPLTVKIFLALLFITAQMLVLYLAPKHHFPLAKGF
jgi:drug/metabolite transporter (DMT)-like permease